MRYSVALTLESPALVGDRREPSAYFLPSRDFIPGSVLRAALARAIKEDCPHYSDGERLNWVRFVDGPECAACRWRGLCRFFDAVRVSHLYISGARPAPLTAYRCKSESDNHPAFDTLFACGETSCPDCGCRAERAGGYLDGARRAVPVKRRLIMRLKVDPYRGVSEEGQLFALRILEEGQKFCGSLHVPDAAEPIPDSVTLRLGAKTTVGLGRATATLVPARASDTGDSLEERVIRFQEKACNWCGQTGEDKEEYTYFSLTLLADTIPDRELKARNGRVPTDVLRRELALAVLPSASPMTERGAEAVRIVSDFKVYGGYQTAEPGAGRQPTVLHIATGSVFVYRMRGNLDDEVLQSLRLLEEGGVGAKTVDGYGAVRICDELHLIAGGMTGGR